MKVLVEGFEAFFIKVENVSIKNVLVGSRKQHIFI